MRQSFKRKLLSLAAAGSLLALAATSQAALAGPSSTMPSHVAKWVAAATKVGTADAAKTVRLSAFLGFRNQDQLKKLIEEQTTPGSANYEHYLKASEFHARFSPSAEDAARVANGLRALGFTIGNKPASNLYIEFSGTVAQVKAAFHVSQNLYSYGGKVMRANTEQPALPASLQGLVTAISGLDETGQLTHPFHHSINDEARAARAQAASAARTQSPFVTPPVAANLPSPYCSNYFGDTVGKLSTQPSPYAAKVPWLVCAYTPQQIRAAYGADKTTLDGGGVTVAIVDAYTSPTLFDDANRYSKNHGLPKLIDGRNYQNIYRGDINAVSASDPCGPQGWFTEISLDVAAVHSMAPAANILYAGALSCSNADLEAAVYTVIDGTATAGGPLASIITNSYGNYGEPESDAEINVDTAVYEQAAAEGVTLLFSSGDDADVALLLDGTTEASYPASHPLVTAVGGTSLAVKDASGRKSEWGWGTFRAYLSGAQVVSSSNVQTTGLGAFSFYSGSGGGPSYVFYQPDYQAGVVPKRLTTAYYDLNGKAYSLPGVRVVPDVSMDADPYTGMLYGETFAIAGDPVSDSGCTAISSTYEYCEEDVGGTSLASPLMAGTLALVDQLRAANGRAPLGFFNPALYKLKVGNPGSKQPLNDVIFPTTPTSLLRGYANDLTRVRLVTINSTPGPYGPVCSGSFCTGQDGWTLRTGVGYDNVTGLGTPYIPSLAIALGNKP